MLKHWTIFEGAPNSIRRDSLRVTLGTNRTINFSGAAWAELGNPIAVELRFDEGLKRIGIKATDPQNVNAFPVRHKSGSHWRWVSAGAFLTHFGLLLDRWVAANSVWVDVDGILVADLSKVTVVGRKSKPGATSVVDGETTGRSL